MVSCLKFTSERQTCHRTYGKRGEDCLVQELEEKRCLSFQQCPREAQAYYETLHGNPKGMCSMWAEAFCFADPVRNRMDEANAEEHARARDHVNATTGVKRACRSVAFDLTKCMQRFTT